MGNEWSLDELEETLLDKQEETLCSTIFTGRVVCIEQVTRYYVLCAENQTARAMPEPS